MSIPSAATFKARHPRFAAVADGSVDLYLAEAGNDVDAEIWDADDYPVGIMLLAAHLMVMEGALAPTGQAPGVGNQLKKIKAGEVEAEFSIAAMSSGNGGKFFDATIYGQRYRELAARNGGAYGATVLII